MISKPSILGLLSQNEAKIAALYTLFSETFPAQERFWKKLAAEEEQHAAALDKLDQRYRDDSLCLECSPYSRKIIDYVSDFIDSCLKEARSEKIDEAGALAMSLRLEQSMVEKKCFEIIIPNQVEIEIVLERLNRETREHAHSLRRLSQLGGLDLD